MSRQARLLVLLALFGLGAVLALGIVAQRYARLALDGDDGAPGEENAAHGSGAAGVEAFVEVREAMHRVIAGSGAAGPDPLRLLRARDRALAASSLDELAYRAVRSRYRAWRAGRRELAEPLTSALDGRRARLERADLGVYEELDR